MEWFELEHDSGCNGPALYRLRLADANGQPVPVPTLLDGPDFSGVIDIGEAGNFEQRRSQIVSGVERCYGHSAGNLFRYMRQFTRLNQIHPGSRLQYAVSPAVSKAQAEDWEAEALKEYFIRRGQLPILNRELPRAYDDAVWNSVWERVFGSATETPSGLMDKSSDVVNPHTVLLGSVEVFSEVPIVPPPGTMAPPRPPGRERSPAPPGVVPGWEFVQLEGTAEVPPPGTYPPPRPLARGVNEGVRPFAGYDDVAQPLAGTSAPLARIETTLRTALSAATTQQPPATVISCLEVTLQTLSAALAELKQIQNKAG